MQDSVYIEPPSIVTVDLVPRTPGKPQTPYQVLRLLPKDATPAQQDSAIQAWFEPGEIRYSEQPDTLHLPGHDVPHDLKAVDIPQYYHAKFFSNDSLYHPELSAGRYGIAGDPIPESINNDNIISSILILAFLLIAFTLSRTSSFIIRQLKTFFYTQKGEHTVTETGNEMKLQIVFVFLTCLLCSLLYYCYAKTYIADTYNLASEYSLITIFCIVFILYFGLKFLLYTIINEVFFGSKKNKKFLTIILFLSSMEGVLLFPAVLLLTFFSFSAVSAAYYCIFVFALVKILAFYKSHIIFFKQNEIVLQNFLYFCALEIVPLSFLWSGLAVIANFLKINF